MQSKATTVEQYLAELPPDRREIISIVRECLLKNLDRQFEEGMQYGMIGYYLPHRVYPAGYHCDPRQPLPFACLASQKNYMSLYMMSVYSGDRSQAFRDAWARTGKKLDMGKSCIRFKKVEDLALDVIADAIQKMSASDYIALYESEIARSTKTGSRAASGKSQRATQAKSVKKMTPKARTRKAK